jgi:hypothetical protein
LTELANPGAAIVLRKYDPEGNVLEIRYLGADEKPKSRFGFAMARYQYGDHGNQIEESCYDADGNLVEALQEGSGLAMSRMKYDKHGNVVETSYYGKDGKLKGDDDLGVAIRRSEYDENYQEIRSVALDKNLKELYRDEKGKRHESPEYKLRRLKAIKKGEHE